MRPQFLQNFYFKFSSVGISVNALDNLYRNRSFVTSVSIMIQQLHFRMIDHSVERLEWPKVLTIFQSWTVKHDYISYSQKRTNQLPLFTFHNFPKSALA